MSKDKLRFHSQIQYGLALSLYRQEFKKKSPSIYRHQIELIHPFDLNLPLSRDHHLGSVLNHKLNLLNQELML